MYKLSPTIYITNFNYPTYFSDLHGWVGCSKTFPSIVEAICSRKKYKIDPLLKKDNKKLYNLLKILGKISNYKDEILLFLNALVTNKYKTIYILPASMAIDEIIAFHLTAEQIKETLFIKLDLHKNSDKIQNVINFLKKCISNLDDKVNFSGVIVCINCISYSFLQCIERVISKDQIIIKYNDMIDSLNYKGTESIASIVNNIKNYTKNILSYSMLDCKKYGFIYEANIVNKDNLMKYVTEVKKKAIFVGFINKDRIDALEKVINILIKDGYLVEIYTLGIHEDYVWEKINKINKQYGDIIKVGYYFDYFSYVKLISDAEILIDIYRLQKDEGNSYRVYEAYAMNKILMTNRDLLANENDNKMIVKSF